MKKNKKMSLIILLLIIIFGITLGYATLSSSLNINGISIINNAKWDIHFENIQFRDENATATTPAEINDDGNTITFEVNLLKPGDFYEFTVDVKNAGTIDGMLESITATINNQPEDNLPNYLCFYISYSDDIPMQYHHLLKAGESVNYKVHLGYKTEIDPSDLPETDQTFAIEININEVQASSNAVQKAYYIYSFGDDSIGMNVNDIDSEYYEDIYSMNATGKMFFTRHLIENGVITRTDLVINYNENNFFIKTYAHSPEEFAENLAATQNIFSNTCYQEGDFYVCIVDSLNRIYLSQNLIKVIHGNTYALCEFQTTSTGGNSHCEEIQPE